MRIAVLADTHGNPFAFQAVLACPTLAGNHGRQVLTGGDTGPSDASTWPRMSAAHLGWLRTLAAALEGRLVRGAWLGLPDADALVLPVPQDAVWHLPMSGARPLVASPGA